MNQENKKTKKSSFRRIAQAVLYVFVILFAIYYLNANREHLTILRNLSIIEFAILASLSVIYAYLAGYTFKLVLELLDIKLSLTETFGLSIIASFGNYLGPFAPGAAIKAVYLKKVKNFSYAKYTAIFALQTFYGIFIMGAAALFCLVLLDSSGVEVPLMLYYIGGAFMMCSFLPFIIRFPKITYTKWFLDDLSHAVEGFYLARGQIGKMILIGLTFILQIVFIAVICQKTYLYLNAPINFIHALNVSTFTNIGSFLVITPSGIGFQEAIGAYIYKIAGFSFTTGVIGLTVIRIMHLLVTIVLTPFFMKMMFHTYNLKVVADEG